MQTIVKQNIISLQSNGQHCLCTIWHPGSNTAWSGHLNAGPVQACLRGIHLVGRFPQQGSSRAPFWILSPRRAPAVPEQGDFHPRRSNQPQAHVKAQLQHLHQLPELLNLCLQHGKLRHARWCSEISGREKKNQISTFELPKG